MSCARNVVNEPHVAGPDQHNRAQHDDAAPERPRSHCGRACNQSAEDDLGRERLMRYGARPPFALDRLRVLAGGRIAYRIKNLGAGRAKHRVMTPVELLARLAAIIPPPR
ncbi:MAG TPA: transposase, partial [Labilithrix sp.]|nr:transposase [Labilithrix sp.]